MTARGRDTDCQQPDLFVWKVHQDIAFRILSSIIVMYLIKLWSVCIDQFVTRCLDWKSFWFSPPPLSRVYHTTSKVIFAIRFTAVFLPVGRLNYPSDLRGQEARLETKEFSGFRTRELSICDKPRSQLCVRSRLYADCTQTWPQNRLFRVRIQLTTRSGKQNVFLLILTAAPLDPTWPSSTDSCRRCDQSGLSSRRNVSIVKCLCYDKTRL